MNKKLKPCVNNMCVGHDISREYNCIRKDNFVFFRLDCVNTGERKKSICPKCITEKLESAWEMFRRLRGQIKSNTIKICIFLCDPIDVKSCGQRTNPIEVIDCLFMQDEQSAINIMRELEKA